MAGSDHRHPVAWAFVIDPGFAAVRIEAQILIVKQQGGWCLQTPWAPIDKRNEHEFAGLYFDLPEFVTEENDAPGYADVQAVLDRRPA